MFAEAFDKLNELLAAEKRPFANPRNAPPARWQLDPASRPLTTHFYAYDI